MTLTREAEVIESVHAHFEAIREQVNAKRAKYMATETSMKVDRVKRFKRINVKKLEDELESFRKKTETQAQDRNALANFHLEDSLKETNKKVAGIEKSMSESLNDLLNKEAYQLTARSNFINYERMFGELMIKDKVLVNFYKCKFRK
jgi:hypothetical protein